MKQATLFKTYLIYAFEVVFVVSEIPRNIYREDELWIVRAASTLLVRAGIQIEWGRQFCRHDLIQINVIFERQPLLSHKAYNSL